MKANILLILMLLKGWVCFSQSDQIPVSDQPLIGLENEVFKSSKRHIQIKKRIERSQSVQSNQLTFVPLGESKNPFTAIGSNRNYISVFPSLNTIGFFRRGGNQDFPGISGRVRCKLFFDYSKNGGNDSTWNIGNGPIWSDDPYLNAPNYNITDPFHEVDYGTRYPQGILWNPPGNTTPDSLVAFGFTPLLDGSNSPGSEWGGLGIGWKKIGNPGPAKTMLIQSGEKKHYIPKSMVVKTNGEIFAISPEIIFDDDIPFYSELFTNKILIYKFLYNPAQQSFDTIFSSIPFSNNSPNPNHLTGVFNSAIAFDPSGQIGYAGIQAYNAEFDTVKTLNTFISKTIDGGQTWTNFEIININPGPNNPTTSGLAIFRNRMLGDFAKIAGDTAWSVEPGTPFAHSVNYMLKDFDLAVDTNGYAHIFAQFAISSFTDTLYNNSDFFYFPKYGTWFTDLIYKDSQDEVKGFVFNKGKTLLGCFGDCSSSSTSISVDNRPRITRSENGKNLAFVWFETDPVSHPQANNTYPNSNPDLWFRGMRVAGPEEYYSTSSSKNVTKGSEYDGLVVLGSVAQTMLKTNSGYEIIATGVEMSPPNVTTADWPVQHFLIKGIQLPDSMLTLCTLNGFTSNQKFLYAQSGKRRIEIFPNPASSLFQAKFISSSSGTAQINLINSIGQSVISEHRKVWAGFNTPTFGCQKLESGIYFLTIQVNQQRFNGTLQVE